MSSADFIEKISENLSRFRKEKHYTQRKLAEMAGHNQNYYTKVERGDGVPPLKTIEKLAKALNVTAGDIIGF